MAETITLADIAVQLGIDTSRLSRGLDSAIDASMSAGNRAGSGFALGFSSPILNAVASLEQLEGGLRSVARVGGAISGVSVAAQYEGLDVAFTSLLRDAGKAKSLVADLREMGAKTPFNTAELSDFARRLLASNFAADQLAGTMMTIADTVSALGLSGEGVGRLAKVLGDIRGGGIKGDDLNQLKNLGLNLADIIQQATGKAFRDPKAAKEFLQKMTPQQQSETILKGLAGRFGGFAEKMGLGTFTGQLQNLGETLQTSLLPTGKLLLPILGGIATGLRKGADAFSRVNEAGKGVPGLLLLVAGGLAAIMRFRAVGLAATLIPGLGKMNTAVMHVTAGVVNITGPVASLVPTVGGAAADTAKTAAGTVAGGGIMATVAKWGRNIFDGVKAGARFAFTRAGGLIGLVVAATLYGSKWAMSAGGKYLTDNSQGIARAMGLNDRAEQGMRYLGAFARERTSSWENFLKGPFDIMRADKIARGEAYEGKKSPAQIAAEKQTKALEDNTKALRESKFDTVGGGGLLRRAVSLTEMEYVMYGRAVGNAGALGVS